MSATNQMSIADGLAESLGRLSKKPGVKATIVLDRKSGAILSSTRTPSESNSSNLQGRETDELKNGSTRESQTDGAESMAVMVWNFVNAAGQMVSELDEEDEVKLLRLRTKKHELVIVPDPKYILIAVHERPTS